MFGIDTKSSAVGILHKTAKKKHFPSDKERKTTKEDEKKRKKKDKGSP